MLLGSSLYGSLVLTFMDLGWWLGHLFEVLGIALVGASAAYDLRRVCRSRPLAGDLRAADIVASEEVFLGARVRALMVRLAAKDTSTEEHTRRVAALAVGVGERLGLAPGRLRSLAGRLRSLAIGGLSGRASSISRPGSWRSAMFYDALVSPRVHRPAWTVDDALALLRDEAGSAFDPQCVDALVQTLGHNVAAFPAKPPVPRLAPTG